MKSSSSKDYINKLTDFIDAHSKSESANKNLNFEFSVNELLSEICRDAELEFKELKELVFRIESFKKAFPYIFKA